MKLLVLFACVYLALAGSKLGKLKNEIADLKDKFATVMNDTSSSLEELRADLDELLTAFKEYKEAQAQRDIDNQWQALHMAAAAACRGSTPQGGKGPWGNSVIPKENGVKCDDQCKRDDRTVCKAEVSLTGYPGKATSYTQIVGHFYNYECDGGWNPDPSHKYNEVAAEQEAIQAIASVYYRFCCCAKP